VDERRKSKRVNFKLKLVVDSLYNQDHIELNNIENEIEILDISRSGLGFISEADMPMNFYFNANIVMDEDKRFFGVLKIIRKTENEDRFDYGCEFIGLADILSNVIDEYDKEKNN